MGPCSDARHFAPFTPPPLQVSDHISSSQHAPPKQISEHVCAVNVHAPLAPFKTQKNPCDRTHKLGMANPEPPPAWGGGAEVAPDSRNR